MVDINAVTADTVDFHSRLMVSCLSPTSVPFLACGGSGWPHCHLAAQCHVWAGAGWLAGGLSHLPGCYCCWRMVGLPWDWAVGLGWGGERRGVGGGGGGSPLTEPH